MVSAYVALKALHIVAAIIALGVDLAFAVVLARAGRDRAHMAHDLRTAKFLDEAIATPGFVLLLLSGGALVWLGGWSWGSAWLQASVGLYVLAFAIGLGVFTPTLKAQIRAADAGRFEEALRLGRRAVRVTASLLAIGFGIVLIMVIKPVLWG